MRKSFFKKSVSVLLSALMLMSCWVWVAPTQASAASTVTPTAWSAVYSGNGDRGNDSYIVICSDGTADTTTCGAIKFNQGSITLTDDTVVTLKLNYASHGSDIKNSVVNVIPFDSSLFPDGQGVHMNSAIFSNVFKSGTYTGTTPAQDVYSYFGVSESDKVGQIAQPSSTSTVTASFDVTEAVKSALAAGKDPAFLFVMTNGFENDNTNWSDVRIHSSSALSVADISDELAVIDAAISAYEAKMDGTIYKNMQNAYYCYISALEARDAYLYGENYSVDLATAATNLNSAVNAMTEWVLSESYTKKTPYFTNDSSSYSYVEGDTHNNIIFTTEAYGDSDWVYTRSKLATGIVSAPTVLVVDGDNAAKMPLLIQNKASDTRYIYKFYPSKGSDSGITMKGDSSATSNNIENTDNPYLSLVGTWRTTGIYNSYNFLGSWNNSGSSYAGPGHNSSSSNTSKKINTGSRDFFANVMQVNANAFGQYDTHKIFVGDGQSGGEELFFFRLSGNGATDYFNFPIEFPIAIINYAALENYINEKASTHINAPEATTVDSVKLWRLFGYIDNATKWNLSHNTSGISAARDIYTTNDSGEKELNSGVDLTLGYNYTTDYSDKTGASMITTVNAAAGDMYNLALAVDYASEIQNDATITNGSAYENLRSEMTTSNALRDMAAKYTYSSYQNFLAAYEDARSFMASTQGVYYQQASTAQEKYEALKAAREALVVRNYDVSFENLFSFASWAASTSPTAASGAVSYDIDAGTVTVSGTGAYNNYSTHGKTGMYVIPVTAGEEYVFTGKASSTDGTANVLGFNTNDTLDSFTTVAFDQQPSGEFSYTFIPASSYVHFRFGTLGETSSTTYSDIALYKKTSGDSVDLSNWESRPIRKTFTYGDVLGTSLEVPVRTGYTFNLWYVDNNGNGTYDSSEEFTDGNGNVISSLQNLPITQDWTLYSDWTINKYTVKFVDWDGTVLSTQEIEYLNGATSPSDPSRSPDDANHYAFAGWDKSYSSITADITVTATYSATAHSKQYAVVDAAAEDSDGNISGTHKITCTSCSWSATADCSMTEDTSKYVTSSCTTDGQRVYNCSYCSNSYTKTLTATGHTEVTDVAVAATCTATGLTEGKHCSVCGAVTVAQTVTEKLPHTEATREENRVEASCGADGSYDLVTYCSVCNAVISTEKKIISATGNHTLGDWITDKEPTCITAGSKHKECENCDYTLTETIAATGVHTYGAWAQYNNGDTHRRVCTNDENCTAYEEGSHEFTGEVRPCTDKEGYHEYKCSLCSAYGAKIDDEYKLNAAEACFGDGTTFEQITDDAANHKEICKCGNEQIDSHSYGGWSPDPENTTDNGGKMSRTCSECIYKETSDCTYTLKETVNATCTVNGHKTYECEHCGNGYSEVLTAPGHTWNDATCTTPKTCSVCKVTEGEALGHTWNDATCTTPKTCSVCKATEGDALGHTWNDATCTTPKTCSVCKVTEGEALGHTWNDATCTTPKTCSVCGATEGEALGHSYETVVTAPTCTAQGYTTYTCSACGDTYKDNYVDEKGHTWTAATCTDPKTCSVCKVTEGDALGHSYETVVTAPTCTAQGYTTYTCSACGDTYKDNYVDEKGHTWTAATCTDPKTCSVCKVTEGDAPGHTWNDATCTTPKTCSVCKVTEGDALGHTWTDATCTTPKTCSVCGATEGKAFGHTWTAATCTTPKTCSVCKVTEGDALGHTWNDATCTTPKTCSVCKVTEGEALGHTWTDATCTAPKTCSVCGATEGEALGHTWTDATCTTPKTCSVCGATEGDALGHSYEAVVTDPTCTEQGYTTYTCANCSSQYVSDIVYANGHTAAAAVEENRVEATCYSEGSYDEVVYCSGCDEKLSSETKIIKKLEHIPAAAVIENNIDPDCENDGSYDNVVYCSVEKCKYEISREAITVDALGHDWDEGAVTKEPTCTEKGVKTYTCQNNTSHTKTEDILALDHIDNNNDGYCDRDSVLMCEHTDQGITIKDYKAATCTEDGYSGDEHCSKCDVIVNYGAKIDKLGHKDENTDHICDNGCGVYQGTHADSADDKDHICDYGCGAVLEDCSDKADDGDHTCDICEKENVTAHTFNDATCTDPKTCSECKEIEGDALGHKWNDATCTTPKTCSVCGATEGEALGHTWNDATCTVPKTCSVCGATEGEALGHDWDEGAVTKEPTCTEKGVRTYICKNDTSHTYTEEITEKGHNMVAGEVVAPTCTADGYTVYICANGCTATENRDVVSAKGHTEATREENRVEASCAADGSYDLVTYCSVCGVVIKTEKKVIPATGAHNYVTEVENSRVPATCKTEGTVTFRCGCGATQEQTLNVDANNHEKLVKDEAVAPDCENTGLTEGEHCEACDAVTVAQTLVDALGHAYESEVTKEPTCTSEGVKIFTCTRDTSHTYTQSISRLNHKDDNADGYCDYCDEFICEHGETETVGANPVTCEFEGYTGDKVCVKCGLTVEKGESIAPTGHSYGSVPVKVIEATCLNGKTVVYKCKNCNETRSEVVSDVGVHHIVVIDEIEATCTKAGQYVHFCLNCHNNVEIIETAPTGHIDENKDGKCDVFGCGGTVEVSGSEAKCSCLCHNDNFIMKIIYKIIRFFWKLFGVSKACDCGAIHY